MHRGNSMQRRVNLGNECTEMQLSRELSAVEVSNSRGLDLRRINLRVREGLLSGFND